MVWLLYHPTSGSLSVKYPLARQTVRNSCIITYRLWLATITIGIRRNSKIRIRPKVIQLFLGSLKARAPPCLAGNVADILRHVADDTPCCSNFGQMGPCRRHYFFDVVAVCVGSSRHLLDFSEFVCRNILWWYGGTYAQIISTHSVIFSRLSCSPVCHDLHRLGTTNVRVGRPVGMIVWYGTL